MDPDVESIDPDFDDVEIYYPDEDEDEDLEFDDGA